MKKEWDEELDNYDWETGEKFHHPAIQKAKRILIKLMKEQVVEVAFMDGDFYISERCDECFRHKLTKEDCLELSKLFSGIADEIKK